MPGGLVAGTGGVGAGREHASHAVGVARLVERAGAWRGASPDRGSTRSTLDRSHRATRSRRRDERAVGGGDLEADALDGDGAVAACAGCA